MRESIMTVCTLQPKYTSHNTPEMQDRGRLIRSILPDKLRQKIASLQSVFDQLFDDLDAEGSDGIGRKTEAPWVRLFSKTMSPNPRTGFYVVIHFKSDGSGFYVTVGCGGTVWRDGDLRPLSDSELEGKTNWARSVIRARWSNIAPFDDSIELGATAPLPKTFEKATICAKLLSPNECTESEIDDLLRQACSRLNEIYLAQIDQRDISPADQDALHLDAITKPLRKNAYGQGLMLSGQDRKAIELHAMHMALEHMRSQGYKCTDTSANQPFDILARKDGVEIKIEVKGTTSDFCESVMMTKNEVDLHTNERGRTGLVIVSSIRLDKTVTPPRTTGGQLESLLFWDIADWTAVPIAFQLRR